MTFWEKVKALPGQKKPQIPTEQTPETTTTTQNCDESSTKVRAPKNRRTSHLDDPEDYRKQLPENNEKRGKTFWRGVRAGTFLKVNKKPKEKSAASEIPKEKEKPETSTAKQGFKAKAGVLKWKKKKPTEKSSVPGILEEPHRQSEKPYPMNEAEKDLKDVPCAEGDIASISGLLPEKQDTGERSKVASDKEDRVPVPVPLTLDKFDFHIVLGEGGFGKVFLATDHIQEKQIAVKILKKKTLLGYPSLLVEHRVLQLAGKCPFLIHGYAAAQTDSYIYFLMELARGGTLNKLIHDHRRLNAEEVRFITAELVCGLQFLYANGIVHGDLKPNNILLTGDGHVKIIDFGMSTDELSETDECDKYHGTPGYIAPEMLQSSSYNQGVDWFSLGIILYEMLTKKHPFIGIRDTIVHPLIVFREPNYKGLGPEKVDILKGLLCKDPTKRLGVHGDIRSHKFFESIDWSELEAGNIVSPLKLSEDKIDSCLKKKVNVPYSKVPKIPLDSEQQLEFKDIGFICPTWATHYYIPVM